MAVYIRMLAYVLSTLAGFIPAAWAGWLSFNETANTVTIGIEGLAAAVVSGLAVSFAIFRKWGVK